MEGEETDTQGREEEVFFRARDLPAGGAREAYLHEACGDDAELRRAVDELLRADAEAGEFLREPAPLEGPGDVVGRYRLVARIGEGGGGEVFRAEPVVGDLPPVALKVVKPGTDTRQVLARFERERRALARMDHPGIARVLDAGATPSGRPFFVMELVDGDPITTYADTRRLDVSARLALFREVCRAVQHAHQKGVVHRDLKPSNVLVAEVDGRAVPKVIDFGIAKAIGDDDEPGAELTRHGLFLGTPQYMSPEQAGRHGLDVDARADIYSLGVLLFELLTGTTPLDPRELGAAGLAGVQRMVDAAVTPRPSRRLREHDTRADVAASRGSDPPRLARLLERDLDWVVLKALERDRERRYASAWELAEDVRRALDDEPVLAGPPSRVHRLRKFVRRNRLAVGAATAVVLALLAAVVGTTAGYVEATAAREELEESNARLSRLLAFQHGRLASIDLPEMGTTLRTALLEHVRRGLKTLGWSDADVDERLAQLDRSLAATNMTSVARDLTRTSLLDATEAAIDEQFADQPVDRAALLHSLALTMAALGLDERALETARRALALRREAFGDSDPRTLDSVGLVAQMLRRLDRLDEAVPLHEAVVRGWRDHYGDDDRHTLAARADLAMLRSQRGDWEGAESLFRDVLARAERTLGPRDPTTLDVANNLAALLESRGGTEEATALYRRVVGGLRAQPGQEQSALQATSNLSRMLLLRGELDEAERMAREALAGLRRRLGDEHPTALAAMNALAQVVFLKGDADEAAALVRAASDGFRSVYGPTHPQTLLTVANHAVILSQAGRFEEAEPPLAEAVRGGRAAFPPDHEMLGGFLVRHGEALAGVGRLEAAAAALLEGREILVAASGERGPLAIEAAEALAELYEGRHEVEPDAGHDAEAARWRAVLDALEDSP